MAPAKQLKAISNDGHGRFPIHRERAHRRLGAAGRVFCLQVQMKLMRHHGRDSKRRRDAGKRHQRVEAGRPVKVTAARLLELQERLLAHRRAEHKGRAAVG